MSNLSCFKAYDIRGKVPHELDEALARDIGRATAAFLKPKTVVVGRDIRTSSTALCKALAEGLCEAGVEVLDIGLCGTEMVYFATSHLKADGGIMVTASHNPKEYNGMKLVREQSKPISGDTGLLTIAELIRKGGFVPAIKPGLCRPVEIMDSYIEHLLTYVDRSTLKPLRIVANPGNGCAGPAVEKLMARLPFELIPVHFNPDGSFPHGVPNPLLVENRDATAEAVRANKADLGLAWDGDYDRCFFFDEQGEFVEGYYVVGLLAAALLPRYPGASIIHDPRLTWNTIATVKRLGGRPIVTKTGHAFIKERMRKEDALYGGEMSAHHYFRDFSYCDSGMIPWLLLAQLICQTGRPLSSLLAESMAAFPTSGEINRTVSDPDRVIQKILEQYGPHAVQQDFTDGVSLEFEEYRFNLRKSNTEPVIRLNVETKADWTLLTSKTEELLSQIDKS